MKHLLTALLIALLSGGIPSHAEMVPDAGEVSVLEKPEYLETVYFLEAQDCQMRVTVYRSQVNNGVLSVRPKCSASLRLQGDLLKQILEKILKDGGQAHAFHTLYMPIFHRQPLNMAEFPKVGSYQSKPV